MSNLTKIAAVLLTVTEILGTVPLAFSAGAEQKTAESPSGTIHFEESQVTALLSGDWGHGTLGYNGKTYKFKATGLGAGGVGVQKIEECSMARKKSKIKQLADSLAEFVPAERVHIDDLTLAVYSRAADFFEYRLHAVVKARSEEEVKGVLRTANDHSVPVTFRAAGTSLSGQCLGTGIP